MTIRQASRHAGLHQTCAEGGTGKDGYDLLEANKISASRRSSCWSLCRDRVRRLEKLTSRNFFLITSFIGSLSSVPYGLTVTMEGFEPYSQSHVMYRGCSQPESVQYLPPNLRPAALLVPLSHGRLPIFVPSLGRVSSGDEGLAELILRVGPGEFLGCAILERQVAPSESRSQTMAIASS